MKRMSPKAFYYTIGKKNFFQIYPVWNIYIVFLYAADEFMHAGICR